MSLTLIRKSELPTAQGVKEKNPITRIVGNHVALKKQSGYWSGLCPFHFESDPSFCVYENSQRFFCYGCAAQGDVISFVRGITGVSFGEALRMLNGTEFGEIVNIPAYKAPEPPKRIDAKLEAYYTKVFDSSKLWEGYEAGVKSIGGFGVEAWKNLGAAWSSERGCWIIPFRNAQCEIIGFQARTPSGDKWTIKKTHLGLFIPRVAVNKKIAYITEGATDCATLLSLGLYAFAKPTAAVGNDLATEFVHAQGIERVIICVDNDAKLNPRTKRIDRVGLTYSEKLSAKIGVENSLLKLPEEFKDIRTYVKSGKTREELESLIPQ